MLTFAEKNQAQKMLLDINHFMIIGQDIEAGFQRMKTYNPTCEMMDYLLELNP